MYVYFFHITSLIQNISVCHCTKFTKYFNVGAVGTILLKILRKLSTCSIIGIQLMKLVTISSFKKSILSTSLFMTQLCITGISKAFPFYRNSL